MNKNQLLFFLFLSFIGCQNKEVDKSNLVTRNDLVYEVNSDIPFTGYKIEEFPQRYFKEGEFEKLSKIDDSDYKPGYKSKSEYSNGKLDGLSIEWYKTGQRNFTINYKNGKMNGKYLSYFDNGQIEYDCYYKKDLLHGIFKSYFKNGQLNAEVEYNEGKIWNIIQDYYENGSEVQGHTIKDGTGTVVMTDNNSITRKVIFKDGNPVE